MVEGTAEVTVGMTMARWQARNVRENKSIHIPRGPSTAWQMRQDRRQLIETQAGDYLGEDDIVRFEDDYGRSG